ncbi:hypothetical protein Sm713_82630 [Streptomyces sp. TS71-3]|nr:hypothetical protein Sm713_50540 [Streptomyces sp. TS71-3]GHJ39512.1 hypothetical protein Sm713_51210 [Streptomyces sp. TS71-3]GHJ42654.1 hypothetical protein Sm713_82630 [Streptomyces sp. TS71-3]
MATYPTYPSMWLIPPWPSVPFQTVAASQIGNQDTRSGRNGAVRSQATGGAANSRQQHQPFLEVAAGCGVEFVGTRQKVSGAHGLRMSICTYNAACRGFCPVRRGLVPTLW